MDLPWKVGKTYKTKCGFLATITGIKDIPIPREMSDYDRVKLLENPFYGIKGFITTKSSPNTKIRASWTLTGRQGDLEHRSSDSGDLTTTEVILETGADRRTENHS